LVSVVVEDPDDWFEGNLEHLADYAKIWFDDSWILNDPELDHTPDDRFVHASSRVVRATLLPAQPCINGCGELGPHYVPPSSGEAGFFTCTPKESKVAG
jgi:hypothetical protein